MKESAKTGWRIAGLATLVGIGFFPFSPIIPANYLAYPTTDRIYRAYLIDENRDGEADIKFTQMMGSGIRGPITHRQATTEDEKDFYRKHRRE